MSSIGNDGDDSTTIPMLTHVPSRRKIEVKEFDEKGMAKEKRNGELGKYVQERRLSRGLSVVEASATAGVDHSFWRKLEAGIYESPSPKALGPIARALDAPLADLYGLAGYEVPEGLPGFQPYLRSKYRLPPEAIAQMESYFAFLRHQYGIPAEEPVFPRRDTTGPASPEDDPDFDRQIRGAA